MTEGQLALPFPYSPSLRDADFLVYPGNAVAVDFLGATAKWPDRRLALWGGRGSGKSHLLHIWAAERGAEVVAAADLRETFWPEGPLAIDDIDQAPSEEALLHLLNAAAEGSRPVLLTASRPPGRLRLRLPDLASRLRAVTAIELGPHDDAFLAALFARLLSERQLAVKPELQTWLLTRLPRTPAALREAVARLDDATLVAKSAVTKPLATGALAKLFAAEGVKETTP